jgi:CheY-like chemotaxis protein
MSVSAQEAVPTVLVVDDDPSVLATYRRLLKRAGYLTRTSGDPAEVLAHGEQTARLDLLLLDYRMPGMNGLSLLAELRRRDCLAPCILVSAYLNDEVRDEATRLGVDRVLQKPVDIMMLRRALDELVPLRERRDGGGVEP